MQSTQNPVVANKRLAKQLAAWLRNNGESLRINSLHEKQGSQIQRFIGSNWLNKRDARYLELICDRLKCSIADILGSEVIGLSRDTTNDTARLQGIRICTLIAVGFRCKGW